MPISPFTSQQNSNTRDCHQSAAASSPPASILIEKALRRLTLSGGGGGVRVYPVALGANATVDKAVEGDCATPVGRFYICAKNPLSKFFRSLCISYPNVEDADRGLQAGLINCSEHVQIVAAIESGRMPPQHTRLGGEIYLHGQPPDARTMGALDWTRGCIALDNAAMEDVYDVAIIGTHVLITA